VESEYYSSLLKRSPFLHRAEVKQPLTKNFIGRDEGLDIIYFEMPVKMSD